MRGRRRFTQAISEGERISLLAEVADADAAGAAEAGGAEGLVVGAIVDGLRAATELPILWRGRDARPDDAVAAGADASVLPVEGFEDEDGRLERLHAEALERGLDSVVAVRDEDELRLALDRLDPEVFLLLGRAARDADGLEHVLSLLSDVPAGKLAIAELDVPEPDDVAELERAGIDAVIVAASRVAALSDAPR
jgi:indole-3-glycerol phosphate synthase